MYKIIKSKRKSIAAKIDENGNILILAPYFANGEIIDRFFNQNKDKILSLQQKTLQIKKQRESFKINGSLKLFKKHFRNFL